MTPTYAQVAPPCPMIAGTVARCPMGATCPHTVAHARPEKPGTGRRRIRDLTPALTTEQRDELAAAVYTLPADTERD